MKHLLISTCCLLAFAAAANAADNSSLLQKNTYDAATDPNSPYYGAFNSGASGAPYILIPATSPVVPPTTHTTTTDGNTTTAPTPTRTTTSPTSTTTTPPDNSQRNSEACRNYTTAPRVNYYSPPNQNLVLDANNNMMLVATYDPKTDTFYTRDPSVTDPTAVMFRIPVHQGDPQYADFKASITTVAGSKYAEWVAGGKAVCGPNFPM